MAKYDIRCSRCGNKYTITLYGPNKDREKRIAYLESCGHCPACEQEARDEQIKSQVIVDEAAGLPQLQGSDKQVAWALSLRQDFISECDKRQLPDDARYVYDYILNNVTKASIWIDNRHNLLALFRAYKAAADAEKNDKDVADNLSDADTKDAVLEDIAQQANTTITPDKVTHSGAVVVSVVDNAVKVQYTYNQDFSNIMRKYHYKYSGGTWTRLCDQFSGRTQDRAAEITNALLTAGFAVQVDDDDIKNMAVSANFAPECRKWVTLIVSGDYAGYLSIKFDRDDYLYRQAKRLPKSKWHCGQMVVPIDCYNDVMDFASMLDFRVSDDATQAIDRYKDALLGQVTAKTPKVAQKTDKLAQILDTKNDVLADLIDD